MRSRPTEFWGGVRAQLPILFGTSPFGIIYGILAMEADLPVAVALGMSMFVFAGSSQVIAAQLFMTGTPGVIIVLTTWVVNLRHMLYSASMSPYIKHLSIAWKYLLSFLLTDEAYAVSITYYERHLHHTPPVQHTNRQWYFFGAEITLWVSWQISTALGVFVGARVPSGWALDFTLALTFIALLIPLLKDRALVLAALTAGSVALAMHTWPYNVGLILAVMTGISVGVTSERLQNKTHRVTSPRD